MTSRRVWMVIGAAALLAVVVGATLVLHEVAPEFERWSDLQRQADLYSRPFEPYVESLRAAGQAVEIDEVDGPMPADADNAAGEIDAAVKWVHDTFGEQDKWPAQALWQADGLEARDAAAAATPALREEMSQFLEQLRPFFDRVDRALDRPHLRYPRTVDPATGMHDDPWMRPVQRVIRLLGQAAHAAPKPEDRLRAIRDCARLGARLDPTDEMSHMMAAADTRLAVEEVRYHLENGTMDPAAARTALDELLARPWFPRMAALLRSERAETIWEAREMRAGRLKDWRLSPANTQDPAVTTQFVAACEVFDEALTWPPDGYREWRRKFEDLLDRTETERNAFTLSPRLMLRTLTRTDAVTRLARIALAAAEHRAEHGALPVSLDELKWAFPDGVPLDPFTDAPFAYTRTDADVRIASVGRVPEEPAIDDAELRERSLVWNLKR